MLHYTSYGKGKTIILIHGFCENSTCFKEQVFLLKDHYRVITIDMPGHGQSPIIPNISFEAVADCFHEILTTLEVDRCVMIGHSMGGYATLAFAKKYNSYLAGIGLLHSTANADNGERKNKRDQAIKLVSEKGPSIYVRHFIPPLFSPQTSSETIAERQKANEGISSEALVGCLSMMKNRADSNDFIQNTDLPVAFFIGKLDTLIPATDMLLQAASVKTGKIVYLENAAHMGMLEAPMEVAEGIKEFADFCF